MRSLLSFLAIFLFVSSCQSKWWGWTPEGAVNSELTTMRVVARNGDYPRLKAYFNTVPESLDNDVALQKRVMEGFGNIDWKVHSANATYYNNSFGQPVPANFTSNVTFLINGQSYETIVLLNRDGNGPNGRKMDIKFAPGAEKRDLNIYCLVSVVLCVLVDYFG